MDEAEHDSLPNLISVISFEKSSFLQELQSHNSIFDLGEVSNGLILRNLTLHPKTGP